MIRILEELKFATKLQRVRWDHAELEPLRAPMIAEASRVPLHALAFALHLPGCANDALVDAVLTSLEVVGDGEDRLEESGLLDAAEDYSSRALGRDAAGAHRLSGVHSS